MAYEFYIDDVLLPVPPERIQTTFGGKNKSYDLISDGEINFLKNSAPTVFEFEFLVPCQKYPFATYENHFIDAKNFIDHFNAIKVNKKPIKFKIIRNKANGEFLYDTNLSVALEEYSVSEDANLLFDAKFKVRLKEFREVKTSLINKSKVSSSPTRSTATKPTAKTHKVVSGDTLFGIAKKYYGDGNLYPKIFNANKDKIKNPNLIYPNQVITIP